MSGSGKTILQAVALLSLLGICGCQYISQIPGATMIPGVTSSLEPQQVLATATVKYATDKVTFTVDGKKWVMGINSSNPGYYLLAPIKADGDVIQGYAMLGRGVKTAGIGKGGSDNGKDDFLVVDLEVGNRIGTTDLYKFLPGTKDDGGSNVNTINGTYFGEINQLNYDTENRALEIINENIELLVELDSESKTGIITCYACGVFSIAAEIKNAEIIGNISDGSSDYQIKGGGFYGGMAKPEDPNNGTYTNNTDGKMAQDLAGYYSGTNDSVSVVGSLLGMLKE